MTGSTLPTVKIGSRTFTILFPDLIPPLSDDELKRLRRSIRRNGVVTPVVVDEEDGVIDGANRLRIAAELGLLRVPVEVRGGLTCGEKVELAYSLNEDRRHMNAATLKRLREERVVRVADARREGKSLRAIAEAEGVSKTQVVEDLKAATVQGCTVQPSDGTVKGKDGKQRPATRRPVVSEPEARDEAGEGSETEAPEPEVTAPEAPVREVPPPTQEPFPEDYKADVGHIARRTLQALRVVAQAVLRLSDLRAFLGRTIPCEFAFRFAAIYAPKKPAETEEGYQAQVIEMGREVLIREALGTLCKRGAIKEMVNPDSPDNPAYSLTPSRNVYDPTEPESLNGPAFETLDQWTEEEILDLLVQIVRKYAQERKKGEGRKQRQLVRSIREDIEHVIQTLADTYDGEDAEQGTDSEKDSKPYNVDDDIQQISEVIEKLRENWTDEGDRQAVRQFLRQCANEV
jgi:hypothetical protein